MNFLKPRICSDILFHIVKERTILWELMMLNLKIKISIQSPNHIYLQRIRFSEKRITLFSTRLVESLVDHFTNKDASTSLYIQLDRSIHTKFSHRNVHLSVALHPRVSCIITLKVHTLENVQYNLFIKDKWTKTSTRNRLTITPTTYFASSEISMNKLFRFKPGESYLWIHQDYMNYVEIEIKY